LIFKIIKKNIFNENKTNDDKKKRRLANIFYKAINTCYNNKTDFSKNFITYTNRAFTNYFNSLFPYNINNQEEFINTYKINLNGSKNSVSLINDDNITIFKEYIKFIYDNKSVINNNGFEFTFYDENKTDFLKYLVFDNTHLLNDITSVSSKTPDLEKETEKKRIIQDIIATRIANLNSILLYRLEAIEIKTICDIGKVNLQDTNPNNCKYCKEVCDRKICNDKLNANNYICTTYCQQECDKYKDENTKKYACGRPSDSQNDMNKEDIYKKEDVKTPIEDDTQMPNFSKIFNYALKFIFIGIVLYILYIFYNMFQETIWTIINLIIYILYYIFYKIYFIRSSNAYAFDMKMAELAMINNRDKFNKVNSKLKSM